MKDVSGRISTENQNSQFMFNILFSPKWCRLRHNVEKCGTAGQNTDDCIIQIFALLRCYTT